MRYGGGYEHEEASLDTFRQRVFKYNVLSIF